jgi:spermidine/putrescine transport system substrate-binding protein
MNKAFPRRRRSRRNFLAGMGAVAAGLTLTPRLASAQEEKRLNFYNWDTYIGETTLEDFEGASGISVTMDLFGDNGELFAKMRQQNTGYDLIVPTNDTAERMHKAGLLQNLDHSLIPNYANLFERFKNPDFDPGRKYSMPYMWGTMGIGYRKSKMDEPTSWSSIWGPDSDRHSGKIAWISESTSMIGMTMKYLGYSYNSSDPGQIQEAADQLVKYKHNVKTIAEDNGQDLLASGECDIVVEWSGDIAQLVNEDADVAYVIPKEGSYIWQDCLCIPADAPRPKNANRFINFLLDAEVGKDLAEYIEYATPNEAAYSLTNDDYRTNTATFPTDEMLDTLEVQLYLGEERNQLISDAWTRIQAS